MGYVICDRIYLQDSRPFRRIHTDKSMQDPIVRNKTDTAAHSKHGCAYQKTDVQSSVNELDHELAQTSNHINAVCASSLIEE